ncbi:immunoglobulin-like domain-containing protein [uncultured Clostridium sp.]|uniref:immunoglobulin-like domain-containing protein n=1 Tax=uncultured Clostridium sp. TaxID=59620 RepID=UPI00267283D8|nr:immunoglobulin-like domain-containing protein [uncultured Clostridium sp.]
MKRKEILVLLGEVLGSRAVYSVASLVITITMLSGITIILRNDIRDIKNYVQSVVDGDPNYKEIHSQVSGSENVIRGNIDVEALLAKEDKKAETTSTANNVSSGYDNYAPTQTVTDDYNNKPSNGLNNSNSGETTIANNNNSNNNLNNSTNEVNNNNNNSDEDKKEDVLDRSSFNGKDVMVSEGEPFNPMNALQLAATDINGKNITNKIVITENNVDTYKPGLYTVKANVTLSNENTLEKEFLVRVEPTILNLAVNDLKISKDVLEKNEHFNLTFAVKSSKSYLEVASVNINNEDYVVNKTSSSSFFRTSNKYEVDLVAPSKAGTEKIEIKSVTMSDGTIVDINKSVNVEILKEEAHIIDAVVKNITSEDEDMFLEYNLEDVDNVLNEVFLYLYDENDVLIQQEELEKNNKSSINLNINENGKYKVQIKGYYKIDINTRSDFSNEKELFTQRIEVNKFNGDNIISSENNDISDEEDLMLMSIDNDEDYVELNLRNIDSENKGRVANSTLTQSEDKEITHEVKITGDIANDEGEFKPGTIQVVVPTAANFTVTKNGDFITSNNMTITNNGTSSIDVIVQKFIDTNGNSGINVQGEDEINKNNLSRSNVSLNINGDRGTAYLGSDNSKSGVYSDPNLSNNTNDGILVSTIYGGSTGKLTLNGEASKGSEVINNPIQDRFTLILKIKKSEKN